MRTRNMVAALGACLVAAVLLSPAAATADPAAPTNRLLAGVGSDTTENVMNDFSNGRTAAPTVAGNPNLASWNTLPLGANITTKSTGCTFPRPFGSGAGVTRLIAELDAAAADGTRRSCVDFARSSSGPSGTGTSLHWVPFAVDGLTYTTRNDSALPTTLSQQQLQSIYLCNVPNTRPLLPQPNSGTRSAWLGFLGVTEAQIALVTQTPGATFENGNPDAAPQRCLSDTIPVAGDVAGSLPLTESVGRFADSANQLIPYSIGQLRAQQSGAITNDSGLVQGRRVGGIIPDIDDVTFPFRRLVYNVVPTQFVGNAGYVSAFGPSSSLCTNPAVLRANGFAPIGAGDPLLTVGGITATGCGDLTTARLRARTAGIAGAPSAT